MIGEFSGKSHEVIVCNRACYDKHKGIIKESVQLYKIGWNVYFCYYRCMEVLSFNFWWMLWNIFLAVLPVGFAWLYFKTQKKLYKGILAVLWLLFLPNSLYVISDVQHIFEQWSYVSGFEKILLLLQYIPLELFGLGAFVLALYAGEKELRRIFKNNKRQYIAAAIATLNFLIGFAIVIGKYERINSWDVFTATDKVFGAFTTVLRWDHMVWLAILFGLFGNFFYFLFRDPIVRYAKRNLKG
jgi:uncharacterized membrane protein